MAALATDRLKTLASEITQRLTQNAVRVQFARRDMDGAVDADGVEFDEAAMVLDAVNLAMGEDVGCLPPEDITPENVDVLYVEQVLGRVEKEMRDRCFHNFERMLTRVSQMSNFAEQAPIQRLIQTLTAIGPDGLGSGSCGCEDDTCPYAHAEGTTVASGCAG
jgi:hypothetical protein